MRHDDFEGQAQAKPPARAHGARMCTMHDPKATLVQVAVTLPLSPRTKDDAQTA